MASPGRRANNSRPLSASRSFQQSLYAPGSSSRPFLNMLNPLGRTYQGYTAANQSLLEEEEEERSHDDEDVEDDVEAQTSRSVRRGKRPSGAAMSLLRPNIHHEDKIHEESESDDDVPQSFMIESPHNRRPPPPSTSTRTSKGKARDRGDSSSALPPGLDVPRISVPPRPSEINIDERSLPSPSPQPSKPMRGLDAYERALWNWVNVYNLDAFLQEVYYYYEGKGIYSIALTRGLNLLSVHPSSFVAAPH